MSSACYLFSILDPLFLLSVEEPFIDLFAISHSTHSLQLTETIDQELKHSDRKNLAEGNDEIVRLNFLP